MSNETTPAIERGAARFTAHGVPESVAVEATRDALAGALDVEEMARVTYREGAWCGVCEYDGWDACADCRETVRGYARALRAAILGAA